MSLGAISVKIMQLTSVKTEESMGSKPGVCIVFTLQLEHTCI